MRRAGGGARPRQVRVAVDVQRHAPQWRMAAGAAALVRKAAAAAVRQGGVATLPEVEIAVALADNAMIREANRGWRRKDSPTNVLSFPSVEAARIAAAPFLGDVIIAYETTLAEAQAEGKRFDDHLAHLVTHGVLHLLGYDHVTAADAELMEARERLILASLGVDDPYAGSEPVESLPQ
jgi:probable rRNA maturation factor